MNHVMIATKKASSGWKDSYKVGIRGIDDDHFMLITLTGQLEEAVAANRARELVTWILGNLVTYVKIHFRREERLMAHQQFPGYEEHKREHDSFARKVVEFQDDYQRGEKDLSADMLQYLKQWVVNHILGTDSQYGPFLREKGVH